MIWKTDVTQYRSWVVCLLASGFHASLGLFEGPSLYAEESAIERHHDSKGSPCAPRIRLVVEKDCGDSYRTIHSPEPNSLPWLLLSLLTGRQRLDGEEIRQLRATRRDEQTDLLSKYVAGRLVVMRAMTRGIAAARPL